MNGSIVKFNFEAPAAFGTNAEINAIIERMEALIPVKLDKWQSAQPEIVKSLNHAYLKAAQLSVFYRLIPGIDIHVLPFGNTFTVDTGVESWKKAADRYCSLHRISYHAVYEEMTKEALKARRGDKYDLGDVGAICYIWRSDKAEVYKIFGGGDPKAALTKGFGHWATKARYDKKGSSWEPDQIPAQRTKQDVARRRALKAALKSEFSLDSLLAAAPNEVSEQLRWLDSDANRALADAAPRVKQGPEVTEDGFVVTPGSVATMTSQEPEQEDDGPLDGLWHDVEFMGEDEDPAGPDDDDNGHWEDAPTEEEASSSYDPELMAEYRMIAEALHDSAFTLLQWSRTKHNESTQPASLLDYRMMVGEIEKLIGKHNHTLLLGVLLGRETHSENRPGDRFVRFLLCFLREDLPQLDEQGKSIKGPNGRVVKYKNTQYNAKTVEAIKETWKQISSIDENK